MKMNLRVDGLARLEASFLALEALDEDQIWGIIEPAAQLLRERMQAVILRLFKQSTGSLHDSIEIQRKLSRGGAVYALVGPNDKKHTRVVLGLRESKRTKKKTIKGTNAEIGWILEHGSARIPGRHWMKTACDESEEEIRAMLQDGFNAACEAAGL